MLIKSCMRFLVLASFGAWHGVIKSSSKVCINIPACNRIISPDRGQPQTLTLLEKACDTFGSHSFCGVSPYRGEGGKCSRSM